MTGRLVTNPSFLFHRELTETVADCCRRLLFPAVEAALLAEMKETADDEAIRVFSQNLRALLLAAPAGPQVVMGIDPGFRTGCKVAVVDATGKFLEHTTIYPTAPHHRTEEAARVLLKVIDRCGVTLIAVGTGTASRETGSFVASLLPQCGRRVAQVSANESGASIYSASDVARAEFPDLDLTVRGAPSALPGDCRTRWPNWSRSTPSRSASVNTSMTSTRASCERRWTGRWSRASTWWAWI